MSIVCIAYIGKYNEPLYFYCKEDAMDLIHLQMIAHSALDIIEEKKRKALQSSSVFDMYFGLLYPIEDYRVYGSYCNTHHKIVVITDNNGQENYGMKEIYQQIYSAFVSTSQNPFQEIGKPLKSKKLEYLLQQIVTKFNATFSIRKK